MGIDLLTSRAIERVARASEREARASERKLDVVRVAISCSSTKSHSGKVGTNKYDVSRV